MKDNRRHLAIVSVLVVAASGPTYFLLNAIFRLAPAASAEAGPIDQMFRAHFMMIAFLFSLIIVFMVYSVFAFRRKAGDEGDGVHFHGHTGLEIAWTVGPTAVVVGFGIWGAVVLQEITSAKENEMVVQVVGRQWDWVFTYPEQNGLVSQELVLPVNRTVALEMQAHDVIHAFWVPEFRVKQDLVPGQTTTLRVTPTQEGEYELRCAEICGLGHTRMVQPVRVVSEQAFADWAAESAVSLAGLTSVELGEIWATDFGCLACHSINGDVSVGPTWLGLFGQEERFSDGSTAIADEAYLEEAILHPNARLVEGFSPVMPANFGEQFAAREAEIEAREGVRAHILGDLIAYIRSLQE